MRLPLRMLSEEYPSRSPYPDQRETHRRNGRSTTVLNRQPLPRTNNHLPQRHASNLGDDEWSSDDEDEQPLYQTVQPLQPPTLDLVARSPALPNTAQPTTSPSSPPTPSPRVLGACPLTPRLAQPPLLSLKALQTSPRILTRARPTHYPPEVVRDQYRRHRQFAQYHHLRQFAKSRRRPLLTTQMQFRHCQLKTDQVQSCRRPRLRVSLRPQLRSGHPCPRASNH